MKHDFLEHYDQGQDAAFEDKPLDITSHYKVKNLLMIFSITYVQNLSQQYLS